MSRRPLLSLLAAAVAVCALAVPASAQSPGGSPNLVVSEAYGGGGNSGATLRNDFIEVFNRGTGAVSLDGRSVQYASATGNFTQVTVLSGTLQPGQYFLVRQAAGTGGTTDLPAPDASGSIAMSATAGKVAIVDRTTALGCGATASPCAPGSFIDLVGYGTTSQFEGAAPAPATTTLTSVQRRGGGCQDTDDNGGDFETGPPAPQNTSSPRNACTPPPGDAAPAVASTTPPDGAVNVSRDGDVTVTFTEPVTAGRTAFSLSCDGVDIPFDLTASPDGTTFTLDPVDRLPADADCTITVLAAGVSDQDGVDPPDRPVADFEAGFRTSGIEGLRIHTIQGRQHISPFRGSAVVAVPGVITARRANGFYLQDPDPDTDERTSEGIFVFTGSAPGAGLQPGVAVAVDGRVTEFRGGCSPSCRPPNFEQGDFGDSAYANLTITEIVSPSVRPLGAGEIAPTVVGQGGRVPPNEIIDNDTPDPLEDDPPLVTGDVESKSRPFPAEQDPTFDPAQDGIDFYESLEGMLTRVNEAVAVEPTAVFGTSSRQPEGNNSELAVLSDGGALATGRTPRGGIAVRAVDLTPPQEYRLGDFNPERIILSDDLTRTAGRLPAADVRDTFSQPVTAVVDYSFGNFKFLMTNDPPLQDGGLQRETTRSARRDELSVASYNVENLDVTDGERFDRIARQIVGSLRSPDVLGLQEVQDDNGPAAGPTPIATGSATWTRLVTAIAAAGGPAYEFRQIDPEQGQDGGEPDGNIRVGFLFRLDRGVRFVDRPGGNATTPTDEDATKPGAQLTLSPGRIDPRDTVFDRSRKPLAGEFTFRGRTLFVIANHFASKGGDAALVGRFQEPSRPSELQRRKTLTTLDPPRAGETSPVPGQAGIVNAFVRRLLDADRRANVVVLGDLNDFEFSETSRILEQGEDRRSAPELVNLWRTLPRNERHSYIFQGNSQVLDHILVSPNLLLSARPELDPVHLNAEFSQQESDHDPLVTRLRFGDDDDEDDDGDDG